MKRCMLSDFEKYCYLNKQIRLYYVEVEFVIRAKFESMEIFMIPDAVYFEDRNGNCLSIHGIASVQREAENTFIIISDYFGSEIKIRVTCLE